MPMTHYEVLGVQPTATDPEIKSAYRAKVKQYHPDAGGNMEAFMAVRVSYDILRDQAKRSSYDKSIGFIGRNDTTENIKKVIDLILCSPEGRKLLMERMASEFSLYENFRAMRNLDYLRTLMNNDKRVNRGGD